MTAKLIAPNHHHGNSVLITFQVERGKKEHCQAKQAEQGLQEKKEGGACRLCFDAAHPPTCNYSVTHMSLTCQYGNYTSSRIIFFCSNASASMTFIHTLLFITHLSTVSDLTMGSIKTNSTGSPAIFLPHSMPGSLLLLIFFFAPLLLGACSQAIMAISPLSLVSSSLIIELNRKHQ